MQISEPAGPLGRLRLVWFAIAVMFASLTSVAATRLVIQAIDPGAQVFMPWYGLSLAAVFVVVGLLEDSARGLVLTAIGATLASLSITWLIIATQARLDVFLFAMPLTIVGSAGVGTFSHAVLHAEPGVARIGFRVILIGFGMAIVAQLVGSPFVTFRGDIRGSEVGTIILFAVALGCPIMAVVTIWAGLRQRAAEDLAAGGSGSTPG